MLDYNTANKLREMKMGVMATSFRKQLDDSNFNEMSFEERVGLMVDTEWTSRRNNRLARLVRNAGFSIPDACLEDIEYHPDRELDKNLIDRLGTCNYVDEHHNIIIMGASGGGKTYLANAFGVTAAHNFHPVRYIRLPDLLGELALARAEGTYRKVIKVYKQVKLLILDEWLLFPLKDAEARDLLEIAEARYKKASTIFCSQFDIGGWHEKIGEATLADAICDRIVHDSYRIVIAEHNREDSLSMRQRKGLAEKT
jgi:DNA replication protein DnaC